MVVVEGSGCKEPLEVLSFNLNGSEIMQVSIITLWLVRWEGSIINFDLFDLSKVYSFQPTYWWHVHMNRFFHVRINIHSIYLYVPLYIFKCCIYDLIYLLGGHWFECFPRNSNIFVEIIKHGYVEDLSLNNGRNFVPHLANISKNFTSTTTLTS